VKVTLVLGTATGGVGAHVHALTGGLLDRGWSVQVCGPRSTDELFGFSSAGAEFREVDISGPIPRLSAVRALRRASAAADVIHAHGLRAGLVAVASRRRPLVVTWHNLVAEPGLKNQVLVLGERVVARGADVTLGASADLVARARKLGGRDVRFAPVAAEPGAVERDREQVRAEFGMDSEGLLVVSVGRLHAQKAQDMLVRAAVRWSDLDARVVIAGDGPARRELAELIDQLAAPVTLLGRRGDVADLLAAADVVVLASRWEARSLAAQEALLLSRPLVVTDVGGMRELVGDAAVVVRAGDVEVLSGAVRSLLTDPARRAQLSARARVQAASWPTVSDTVEQIVTVYRGLNSRRT
jgi:glycosyltransferase involved in cell wall biosynthesis